MIFQEAVRGVYFVIKLVVLALGILLALHFLFGVV